VPAEASARSIAATTLTTFSAHAEGERKRWVRSRLHRAKRSCLGGHTDAPAGTKGRGPPANDRLRRHCSVCGRPAADAGPGFVEKQLSEAAQLLLVPDECDGAVGGLSRSGERSSASVGATRRRRGVELHGGCCTKEERCPPLTIAPRSDLDRRHIRQSRGLRRPSRTDLTSHERGPLLPPHNEIWSAVVCATPSMRRGTPTSHAAAVLRAVPFA
jgi:hypothetical protein